MGFQKTYRFPFAKYPAIRLVLLFCLGIIADTFLSIPVIIWYLGITISLGIIIYLDFFRFALPSPGAFRKGIIAYLLLVVFFSGWRHSLAGRQHTTPSPATLLEFYAWDTLHFRGNIYEMKPSGNERLILDIDITETRITDSLSWSAQYRLRTYLDSAGTRRDILKAGSELHFKATVYPLEEPRNPGEFDYKSYLYSQNISGQAGIDSIVAVRNTRNVFSWNTLRNGVLRLIEDNFGGPISPLAKALMIGYKNELDRGVKQAFSRAGLSHIMAVSGLHVGFIIAPVWLVIPYLWTLRYGKQCGFIFLALILFFYAGLTGFSASVCRASLTGGFLTYGRLFHKVRDSKNLTAASALVILIIDPDQLFDIGFQLSFSAVYIILLVIPVINQAIPPWIRFRWYGKPVMIIIVSMVVQAGLYPLLSYYFGEFSLAGPLANALVVPLLTLAVPLSLFLLLISVPFPTAGKLLNIPNRWILEGVNHLVKLISSWEWSWIHVQPGSYLVFLLWAAGIFFLSSLTLPRIRWRFLGLFLLMLSLYQGEYTIKSLSPKKLTVLLFDVGQGDAALVSTPAGSHFLIDTGRWSPGFTSAQNSIIPYLEQAGIQNLDAVFLSHPHADHIGGMPDLIDAIPIDTIYDSGLSYTSALYTRYRLKAERAGIPVISLETGDRPFVDESIRILIYAPPPRVDFPDPNKHSLVLEVIYGQTEFLFTGDTGMRQEQQLISDFPKLINSDFLKIGHHGSRTSTSRSFLEAVTPDIAVASLALDNPFGHPHREAINRLYSIPAELYFTSLDKALVFSSDGEEINPVSWQ